MPDAALRGRPRLLQSHWSGLTVDVDATLSDRPKAIRAPGVDLVTGGTVYVEIDVHLQACFLEVVLAHQKLPLRYRHGLGRCGGHSHQSSQLRDTDQANRRHDLLPKAPHVGPKRIA